MSWWEGREVPREPEYTTDLELVKKKTSILDEAYENKKHMNKLVKYHISEDVPQVASQYQRLYEDLPLHKLRYPKNALRECKKCDNYVLDKDLEYPEELFPRQPRICIDPRCDQSKAVKSLKEGRYHVEKTCKTQRLRNITFPPLYNKEDDIKLDAATCAIYP